MRKVLAVLAAVVAILGVLAPPVLAQTVVPKVTINGLFDQITSAGRNIYDGNWARAGDNEWYARTRFRPDFTFEVGRTKAVLGLEIDMSYGQSAINDGGYPGNVTGAACGKGGGAGCLDINTDVAGLVEIKWMYTEFLLTGKGGLMPFIPIDTIARVGGQPIASLATYKSSYFGGGDFAGVTLQTQWTPMLKTNFIYAMVEEELAGQSRGALAPARTSRGDDYAVTLTMDIVPFKGLQLKPLYSYFHAEGATSGSSRRAVSDLHLAGGGTTSTTTLSFPQAVNANGDTRLEENRHTIGMDARWRWGALSLDPTIFYQFGTREQLRCKQGALIGVAGDACAAVSGSNVEVSTADMSSWLIDLQAGFQLGPLLLEARYIYSTGNRARNDLSSKIRYFEPLDLDTGYYAGWAQIFALGLDYYNGGAGPFLGMATNIGYDRYGRHGFGLRATYNFTPALALWTSWSPTWTAEKVDTDTGAARAKIAAIALTSSAEGDKTYLGTEGDLGLTWQFAPNTVFEMAGAYLWAGGAVDVSEVRNGVRTNHDAADGWTVAARIRFSF